MDASLGVEVDTMNRNDRGELVIYKLCFSLSQQSSQLSIEVIQLAEAVHMGGSQPSFSVRVG